MGRRLVVLIIAGLTFSFILTLTTLQRGSLQDYISVRDVVAVNRSSLEETPLEETQLTVEETQPLVEELKLSLEEMQLPTEASQPEDSKLEENSSVESRFAYAFLMGGCDPAEPAYLGFLYNILVAAQVFKEVGSSADVVVFAQMRQATELEELPSDDLRALDALNVTVRYIPKTDTEDFYSIVLDKLRVLTLTEYDRVLFMDGDAMPLGNLDYLFDLSVKGVLKENFIFSTGTDPCNAGFFMLTPGEGEWERVVEIVRQRELSVKNATHLKHRFDEVQGWGHPILPPDHWRLADGKPGYNWTFPFAYSDQGLLYYYAKYIKRNFSILFRDVRVENWVDNGQDFSSPTVVELESTVEQAFVKYSQPRIHDTPSCSKWKCDYTHFTGFGKPWLKGPPADLAEATEEKGAEYLWWLTLQRLNADLDLGLHFDENWVPIGRPPLGTWAIPGAMDKRVEQVVRRFLRRLF